MSASAVMRDSHASLFRALGHEVSSFNNVEGFLDQFAGGRGLLCIDAHDPVVSSTGCLRLLRRHGVLLPIVLLIGHLPADYQAALSALYAPLRILTKPVSARLLLEAAEALGPPGCHQE